MGAWADMTLSMAEVKGLAENLLTDRQSGGFNPDLTNMEREQAAKGRLEDVLFKAGGLAAFVDDAGGPDALLDALADDATLNGRLQRGFALAFLDLFADDDAVIQSGRTAERSGRFAGRLKGWAKAFGSIAPHVLGYTNQPSPAGAGAFASTMSTT